MYRISIKYNEILTNHAKFASSIAYIGDIDGSSSIMVGSPGQSSVFTIFLKDDHITLLSIVESNIRSNIYKSFGTCIAPIGDVNNDGMMDLLISSSNTIHLVFLSKSGRLNQSIPLQLHTHIVNNNIDIEQHRGVYVEYSKSSSEFVLDIISNEIL